MPAPTPTPAARLSHLRKLLSKHSLSAYLVPSDDVHANEYVCEADKRRQWISGFGGSAGTAVVMPEEAHLFTDGRYHQQAEKELSSEWTLQRYGLPGASSQPRCPTLVPHSSLPIDTDVKPWQDWLTSLPKASRIGLDPTLLAVTDFQSLSTSLASTNSAVLVPIAENLVDQTWVGRPERPKGPVNVLREEFAGESLESKVERIRKEAKGKWGVVVGMLDEICWTLNLRGSDISYNPVFWSYLVIPVSSPPTLFIDIDQLPQPTYEYLEKNGILIEPYEDVIKYLEGVGKLLGEEEKVIVPSKTNLALSQAVGLDKISVIRSPIGDLKAVKNETEIAGFRACHIRDGVALVRYFAWLESELLKGTSIREYEGSTKLEEFRSELPMFQGLSFTTISSTGANGSVIHYQPSETDSKVIDKDQIYLNDSGAQFLDGTTDTTRTWHFGTPREEERRAATRVLQGHIAIDELIFPSTTTGYLIDAFARRALWQDGLDYRHGTGHGVGHFLNVHEGPHGIGTRIAYNDVKLRAGYTVSNEPGYYEDGKFGIRIENVLVVKKVETRNDFGGVGWLGFERFTMCPISTKLVDVKLMSPGEIRWLNEYNAEVRSKLLDLVEKTEDQVAVEWLLKETEPLEQ